MKWIETLQLLDGRLQRTEYHARRMQKTVSDHLNAPIDIRPLYAPIPARYHTGTYKYRILYDEEIRQIDITPYTPRPVRSLKLVDGNGIRYAYKQADRSALDRLKEQQGECDDILIHCHGQIADTSFSNLLFARNGQLYTPHSYLLNGTRRQYLLERGIVRERIITIHDLPQFDRIYLINALIGPEESTGLPLSAIEP